MTIAKIEGNTKKKPPHGLFTCLLFATQSRLSDCEPCLLGRTLTLKKPICKGFLYELALKVQEVLAGISSHQNLS